MQNIPKFYMQQYNKRLRKVFWILIWFIPFYWSCENNSSKDQGNEEDLTEAQDSVVSAGDEQIILCFGNSITAGYGLNISAAFPALIQERLDSLGYNYKVVNAGLSGETTAGGLNRIEWVLRTVPDIFILELGANDGLRGLDLAETKKNLKAIIAEVRAANPEVKIILAGMLVPPNMGREYATAFMQLFPEVAEETDVSLIPFILDGVAGDPNLNQSDGIHPTAEGHAIVAENVWEHLKPLLEKDPL